MSMDALLACLQAYPRPEDAEGWVLADTGGNPAAAFSEDYCRAVHDVLVMLGLVSGEPGVFSSPTAYYFVQSLICALRDGALTPESWRGDIEADCAGTGARLLQLLEAHRLACTGAPTPLRDVRAVMAIIKARRADADVYLMQFDRGAGQFQPLGGKRELTDASNEAALTRELCEELDIPELVPGRDFNLHPLVEHARVSTLSASLHVVTQYDHSFYHLTDVRFALKTDPATRWISARELVMGKTEDGYRISALIEEHLSGILAQLAYSLPEPVD